MAYTIAVINQKGGVGKSTTAQALHAGLLLTGCRSLIIDLDAQGNTSFTLRADKRGQTIKDVLTGDSSASAAVQHLGDQLGDIIPGESALAGADAYLNRHRKEYILRDALAELQTEYDFIILDTPPALGVLTVNALAAAQGIVVPVQADIYSLQGAEQLGLTLQPILERCNPQLRVLGLLLTRYSLRSVLSRDVAELAAQLADRLSTKVFSTTIREAVAVREAQISRLTLFEYAPRAKVTQDYKQLIEELRKDI